jgi:hypothetical protein
MKKSARILGQEFGKNAQEMNKLFNEYGYLEGKPGAWKVTEKGEQYAEERPRSNGHGGWAARSWEERVWDESVVDALKKNMAESPELQDEVVDDSVEDTSYVEFEDDSSSPEGKEEYGSNFKAMLGGVFLVYSVFKQLKPYAKPIYNNRIKPAAQQMRDKFRKPTE